MHSARDQVGGTGVACLVSSFAIVTAAHLHTRQTKNDPQKRYQAKRTLVRLLYTHGWDRQRILDLFAVLDWMMRLPDGLEQKLWQDIEQIEGETRMRYVTSVFPPDGHWSHHARNPG